MSVFPAPISNIITLSVNSFLSSTSPLSESTFGTIPSISIPAFLRTLVNCFTYSLSANITCPFTVNDELRLPTGSSIILPLSNINWFAIISIKTWFSGISISLTCIIADVTSLVDIPAYLSFASFTILFCTIVTYLPGIVT